ncbi:hypothetical protein BDZ45DRAFT_754951 [Acephala macrosclerotiorum]|nr:hypothetical protein BDZ45DRAFT_754951 [Acephala macrosclerotiorum]
MKFPSVTARLRPDLDFDRKGNTNSCNDIMWLQVRLTRTAFGLSIPSYLAPHAQTWAVIPQDTGFDSLWGCYPGFICNPPQVNCDTESEPPTYNYLCPAEYCVPAPPVPPQPSLHITGTSTFFSPYPLPTGYFNLNPALFGADWGIFTGNVSVTPTLLNPISSASSNFTTIASHTPSATPFLTGTLEAMSGRGA